MKRKLIPFVTFTVSDSTERNIKDSRLVLIAVELFDFVSSNPKPNDDGFAGSML